MSNRFAGATGWLLYPVTAAMMLFVLSPLLAVVSMSVSGSAFATFPPRGFTLSWYATVLADADFQTSLAFSTMLALGATAGALLLGVPAAFALIRYRLPGCGTMPLILLSPLIFPVLVTGVALLRLFSDWGSNLTTPLIFRPPRKYRQTPALRRASVQSARPAAATARPAWWGSDRRACIPGGTMSGCDACWCST